MSDVSPAIEAQIIRVLEVLTRAAERADQRVLAEAAQPGLAADYARRHPAASITDIMAATGCSRTTAREATRGNGRLAGAQTRKPADWRTV